MISLPKAGLNANRFLFSLHAASLPLHGGLNIGAGKRRETPHQDEAENPDALGFTGDEGEKEGKRDACELARIHSYFPRLPHRGNSKAVSTTYCRQTEGRIGSKAFSQASQST